MADPELSCPPGADTLDGASKSGDYTLRWTGDDGAVFRLVERTPDGEHTLYEGPDFGSTVTGRTEGRYDYHVGVVQDGTVTRWSESCGVVVAPYPLSVAFAFFGFGLVVTIATVTLIVRGHRAHKRGEIG